MLARVSSMGVRGVEGYPVLVELDLANGLPGFTTVGLPDSAVRESRERVASAVRNSGYRFPQRRITVNLAPAQSRKEGTHYDLPIALAVLSASGQIPSEGWPGRYCFIGELALDGSLRPVPGVLAMALQAKSQGFEALVVPQANAAEARATGLKTLAASCLREVAEFLADPGRRPARGPSLEACAAQPDQPPDGGGGQGAAVPGGGGDLSDVKGQALAKRALEIAAAGGHNILLIGPPGAGKSMLARRLAGLLPPLTEGEALEASRVHSLCRKGGLSGLMSARPFRAPHHSASTVSLIGGGPAGRPGEAALAHGGVLFLDELGEFGRSSLEALRQPLEDCRVVVARARETAEYPARFLLVAATNPCPCGFRGHPRRECLCTPPAVQKYLSRLSGPLLDRIDIQVEMAPLEFEHWAGAAAPESSARVRERVAAARGVQRARFLSGDFAVNAYIPAGELRRHCALDGEGLAVLKLASRKMSLSARSLDRVLKVARTIADLSGAPAVRAAHLSEAMQYRGLDRLKGA